MVMPYTGQDRARDYIRRETGTEPEAQNTDTEAREGGFTGASRNVIDALNAHKVISDRDYQKVVEASKDRRRRILETLVPRFLRDRVSRRHLLLAGGILTTGLLGVSTIAGLASGESVAYGATKFITSIIKFLDGAGKSKIAGEIGQQIQSGAGTIQEQAESGLKQLQEQLESTKDHLRDKGLLQIKGEKQALPDGAETLSQERQDMIRRSTAIKENGPMVDVLSRVLGESRAEDVVQTIGNGVVPLFGDKYLAPEGQYDNGGKYAGVAVPAVAGLGALFAANQANKIVGDIRHVVNPESAAIPLRRIDDRAMLRASSDRGNSPTDRAQALNAYRHNKQRSDFLAKSAGYLTA